MANYVYIENNQIVEYHDKLPKNWKHISGLDLMTPEQRLDLGWYWVENISDVHDSETQYIAGYTYDILTDKVVQTPQIISYTEEELAQRTLERINSTMAELRSQRDQRLTESDWTQTLDIVELKGEEWRTAWKVYRQELRDLPSVYENTELTDLQSVVWPTPPQS
jgi:hypothetical protein